VVASRGYDQVTVIIARVGSGQRGTIRVQLGDAKRRGPFSVRRFDIPQGVFSRPGIELLVDGIKAELESWLPYQMD
jgi:hypothetical protein